VKDYSSILIIYNPGAMKGEIENHIPRIKQRLLLRFSIVDSMSSQDINGAEILAQKYASKYDVIVSCGGDGTLNQVINGVMKSGENTAVGILPCGTCNDVARTLNIPKKLDQAVDSLLRLNIIRYDLMYDGSRYMSYSLATGYMTKCSYSATSKSKKRFGRFAYVITAIKDLFNVDKLPITVTADGERLHGKFLYCMLVNGVSVGGFKMNKDDNLSDGKVKLVMIRRTKGLGSLFAMIKLFIGGIRSVKKNKHVIIRDVSKVFIENHANSPFTMDGEKTKFLKKNVSVVSSLEVIKG